MEVRSIEGKAVEDDIGYIEREQRGPGGSPHLLPRKVRRGSSVAKEVAEGNGSSWDLAEAETKARRETGTKPFRCQQFGTGIIRKPLRIY